MELIIELPNEIKWKVFKYLQHPVAEIYCQYQRNMLNEETIRRCTITKKRLQLLRMRDNKLEVSRVINSVVDIEDKKQILMPHIELLRLLDSAGADEKQHLITEYTKKYKEIIRDFEKLISVINNTTVFDKETILEKFNN